MIFDHQITVNTIAISHKTVLLSHRLKKENKTCLIPNSEASQSWKTRKHAIVSDHPKSPTFSLHS
jgi:hypothetical protein